MLEGIKDFQKGKLKHIEVSSSAKSSGSKHSSTDGSLTAVLQNALDGISAAMVYSSDSDEESEEDDEEWN